MPHLERRLHIGGNGFIGFLTRRPVRPVILLILLLVLGASVSVSAASSARAQAGQDIVFLLDTSSSMENIFGEVKAAILDYARQAQPEDTIILITFSEKVQLRFRQKISSPEDIRRIEKELGLLEPDQYYTYMTAALDKGMEQLRLLGEREPNHLRTMVLLSDGKNNPPPTVTDPVSFDELLERYPGLLQGSSSAFFYLSLGDNPDPDVVSWMESANGKSIDLGQEVAALPEGGRQLGFAQVFVEPVSLDLGAVSGPKATVPVSLAFFPARGDPSGQAIQLIFKAGYQENPSWKTLLEARPGVVTCSRKPWSATVLVEVDSLHEGTVVGTLELKPLPGTVLFIDPPEIPVVITTHQPKIAVELRERLKFGPIYPSMSYSETKTVGLTSHGGIEPADIRVTTSVSLPEEIGLRAEIKKEDAVLQLRVAVEARGEIQAAHSRTFEGTIVLSGANYPIEFSDDEIEVAVEVAPPPAKSRLMAGLFSWIKPWMIGAGAGAGAIMAGGIILFRLFRSRPMSALEGKLVMVNMKDPSLAGSRAVTGNLNSLGRMLRQDCVVIGSAKEAGLTLPHKSVSAYHCEIYVKIDKGTKRILIEPLAKNRVIVNLQKLEGPVPLSDRDLVEIGAYTFRFENPHPYKQIVVRYLDGRILKGTPASWDIDGDGFNLLPRDALPGSTEEIYVSFSDLKAVYFVRDFDGQIGKKLVSPATQIHGIHLLLTFHDGEKIEGYTSQSYNLSSPRFYFFPADQSGNTISMLVERQHLKIIRVLENGRLEEADRNGAAVSLSGSRKSA